MKLVLACILTIFVSCHAEKITEKNLHNLLSSREKIHLFGSEENFNDYQIVNSLDLLQTRHKRSTNNTSIKLKSFGQTFDFGLDEPTTLLDENFQFISRWANTTEELVVPRETEEERCYFRSQNAAISICGGVVRGVFSDDQKDFFTINSLPERFHSPTYKPHLVIRKTTEPEVCPVYQPSKTMTKTSNLTDNKYQSESVNRLKRSTKFLPGVPIHVEIAVFIDKDLYQHMQYNYPTDTERELIRFILAMINAVQLLYHDDSLGRQINFVLKRLEILHEEPTGLKRPHDIDRFLSSFCGWQRKLNPPDDSDPAHWDHALMLTGLDLFVVSKNGKISNQVVGLAPVAGMCTITSSCTVNEGRHFESVYVVAHEIGHNLGMRHDGPLADNNCDPTSFIMSPTLGSGKITWSACSRKYLQTFLDTTQSKCLLDHSSSAGKLDHSAEGVLPGERFDADQQCMLKYGKGSKHSYKQPLDDICRDLHCQRDRYTWTSHPALEGTRCGVNMWCKSGKCTTKEKRMLKVFSKNSVPIDGGWSEWEVVSDCASGCLYGEDGRLSSGSTGAIMATRLCDNPAPLNGGANCKGSNKQYQICNAQQCLNVPRMTINEFGDQICNRAKEVDEELTGTGLQRASSDAQEACVVWCHKRKGGSKTRGWTYPDGTTCQLQKHPRFSKPTYCISGTCQEFSCDQSKEFVNDPSMCMQTMTSNTVPVRWKNSIQRRESSLQWISTSGCHSNCMTPGIGLRLVKTKESAPKSNIQLCTPDKYSCGRLKTPHFYATTVCSKFKERVRRISGVGIQLSAVLEDPDRACRIACQDESILHRFYLVNGEEGWFPFGTDCSKGMLNKKLYCVSGKCLEFGLDNTPLSESEFTLPLLTRLKRSIERNLTSVRAVLNQHDLDEIIAKLNATFLQFFTNTSRYHNYNANFDVDYYHPVHVLDGPKDYGDVVNGHRTNNA